jgi:hypothetical protein
MISEGCACGGVRLKVSGRLGPAVFFHCSQCRKANGSAFACNAPARARYLEFELGRDLIREFESSPQFASVPTAPGAEENGAK